jgi:hypothetical protein
LVDCVYVDNDATVILHEMPRPTLVDVEDIADRVGYRLRAILKRHGLRDETEAAR